MGLNKKAGRVARDPAPIEVFSALHARRPH